MIKKSASVSSGVRLDKWLWAARFFKTRALATDAINGGKVRYNNERIKPSKMVQVGATITLRQGDDEKTIIVLQVSAARGSASIAQTLFTETELSQQQRAQRLLTRHLQPVIVAPITKPNKKERRQLQHFKQRPHTD